MAQVALMLNISERLTIAYRLKEQFYNVMASRSKHEITVNKYHIWLIQVMQANFQSLTVVLIPFVNGTNQLF